ncbi:hypothetical protein N0V85_006913 [Neurospora sp. IMI 360204]|nr:hypothetical protein N0V85_006913 [Neurospora sp. IMI 360204]
MQSLIQKASVKSSDVFNLTAIKIHIAGFSTSRTRLVPRQPRFQNPYQKSLVPFRAPDGGVFNIKDPTDPKPGSKAHIRNPWPPSEQQKKIIAEHPLGGTLDSVRDKLRDSNEADETHRGYIADLLHALIDSPAACKFPFPDQVDRRLFALRRDVRNGEIVNLHPFRPLVRVVVDDNTNDNSYDNAIWAAVFSLLDTLSPHISIRDKLRDSNEADETYQTYIEDLLEALMFSPATFSIPFPDGNGYVVDSLIRILQDVRGGKIANLDPFRPLVRHIVDNSDDNAIWAAVFSLADTLIPRTPATIPPTFKGTPVETRGFMDKFFNPESWRDEQKAMLEKIMTEHNGAEWTGFPATPDENQVWDWLRSLEERFLADAPYKLHTTASANRLGERKGQMNIFIQTPITAATTTFEYKHVLVVGEHKNSYDPSRFKWDFLQLTRHVRNVFTDQPTRRFVHAFSLCASNIELWIFDRAGAYSSGPFDIHDKPDMFARALVGYVTMDSDAMGLDTFIEREGQQRYIKLNDTYGKEMRIRLNKAIHRPKAIVCRGTTCYESENNTVAKFAWVPLLGERTPEVEYLTQAKEKGVKGMAGIVAHHRITTIVEIRKGLQFPTAHRFHNEEENSHFDGLPSTTTSTDTPGYKRKAPSDATTNTVFTSNKKQRFDSQRLPQNPTWSIQPPPLTKRNKTKPTLSTPSKDPWEEKIYSCLVISPAGHVISRFGAIKQLLESMRDAIKAHQSLYVTGNILHRDISPNNIIMTDPRIADGFKGMLIDLDMAAKVGDDDDGPSGAQQKIIGTVPFTAIEVMRNMDHTYRHDLESFFYVLLWLCARQSWSNGFSGEDEQTPEWSILERWEKGTFSHIALAKQGDMSGTFVELLEQFPESFKVLEPLCRKIKDILFHKGSIPFGGTPEGDPDQLYKPIIEAYNEAIDKL